MDLNRHMKSKYQMLVIVLLVVVCVVLGGCSKKTQEAKVYRVGILSGSNDLSVIADGFKGKMNELGYVEGENVVYELHKVSVDSEWGRQVAEKFVQDKVNLILALPTESALAAKAASRGTGIPVVFVMANIEGNNLVESVRQPGENITGVRDLGPDNVVKRLEILSELVPQAKRVYVPYNLNYPDNIPVLECLRPTALSLGITLVEVPVTNVEDIQADLQARAESDDIDDILLLQDALVHSPYAGAKVITEFAKEYKLPVAGVTLLSGVTFSYGADLIEMGRLAAPLADKIFRGIPAGKIPVVTPQSYLRLNYKVIQELGLNVSEGLLSRADEIIR